MIPFSVLIYILLLATSDVRTYSGQRVPRNITFVLTVAKNVSGLGKRKGKDEHLWLLDPVLQNVGKCIFKYYNTIKVTPTCKLFSYITIK